MTKKISEQLAIIQSFLNKLFFRSLGAYLMFAAAFTLLAELLSNIKFLVKIDILIQRLIMGFRFELLTKIFTLITNLGDTKMMVFWTAIAALLLFRKKQYIYSLGIVLSIGIPELLSFIIKNAVDRHRPPAFMALVAENSPSFPSGHTIAALSFFGFLIYFFNKNIANKSMRNLLNSLCVIIILMSGFIRIYLGAHWPSDVLASYILGGAWLWIIIILIEKHEKLLKSNKL